MTEHPGFLRAPKSHFFLFGPRGTGKSTWLHATYPDALWFDLLDPDTERTLTARPEALREQVEAMDAPGVVVVDEVQRAPGVLTVVHQLIEQKRLVKQFVLTGSSSRRLKRAGVDLLGGRAIRIAMHPFMASELGTHFDLGHALRLGTVPGVLDAFGRFIEAIGFSHGATLNLANVARDCQVSRTTVEGFVEVIEDLMLAFRLPVFRRRAQRQLTVHPKFYWFDAGVFRASRPSGPLDRPEEIDGAALEGLVAQHLRAWIDYSEADLQLFFWRTKPGTEVDFIVYGADGFWAIEVENRARVRPEDLRALAAFGEDYPQAKRVLVYRGRQRLRTGGVLCLPCDEFLAGIRPGKDLPG